MTKNHRRSIFASHNDRIASLGDVEQRVKRLEDEVESVSSARDAILARANEANPGDEVWEQYVGMQDKLIQLKDALRKEQENDVVEYLSDTSQILMSYFNSLDGDDDTVAKPAPPVVPSSVAVGGKSPKTIMNWFCKSAQRTDDRGSLCDKYNACIDKNHVRRVDAVENSDNCRWCAGVTEFKDGIVYCKSCHAAERCLVEAEKHNLHKVDNECMHQMYKRINHLNETLSQVQAKEYTDLPPEVIDAIIIELQKRKITDMSTLTPRHIRDILKKLKLARYEHVTYILYKLNGIAPPQMGPELEEQLRQMFNAIQVPFYRHVPKHRKNFVHYHSVVRKFLMLLGRTEFLQYFPLLKSREKVFQQEQLWRKICADLGWQFIPSI